MFQAVFFGVKAIYFLAVLIIGLLISGIGFGVRAKTGSIITGGSIISALGFTLLVLTYLVDGANYFAQVGHRGAYLLVALPLSLVMWGLAWLGVWMVYEFFKE